MKTSIHISAITMGVLLCGAAVGQVPPAFGIASVKLLKGPVYRANIGISGNRVTASGPLEHLIELAYGVKEFEVVGGPDWVRSGDVLYEITAKTEGDDTPARPLVREMLRGLLETRFGLKMHREIRQVPLFSLVVDRGGSKLKKVDSFTGSNYDSGPISKITAGESMAALAGQMEMATGFPVLNRTALEGFYRVELEWSAEDAVLSDTSPPPLSSALQRLGLRLVSSREPFEVLVIERAEKPSEN